MSVFISSLLLPGREQNEIWKSETDCQMNRDLRF